MDFMDRMRSRAQERRRGSYLGEYIRKGICSMSQHDMNAANASGATVRGDYNNALVALATLSSGATAPATTFAYQLWADTTSGTLKRRNAANTGWIVVRTIDESFVLARSSNTILDVSDIGKAIVATGTFTQTLDAAATLGDGWMVYYLNNGTGLITVDPNAAELVDGVATIVLNPGESCIIKCSGTAFSTLGRSRTLDNKMCDGRLTLTTAVPVTTADVTAATSVKFTPYAGNRIALYNGTFWELRNFAELSVAVPATTSTPFDIFAYDNAGTVALEALDWTNDTTRATALVLQDGVLVKTGATTRRYLGTGRTTTVSGQTEDSKLKRYLWNYYNRVPRHLERTETTASWTWSTASFQQANASAANQVDTVIGWAEDAIKIDLTGQAINSTATGRSASLGIGVNSTTVDSATMNSAAPTIVNTGPTPVMHALYRAVPAVGRAFYAWLEKGAGTDTQTWNGTGGASKLGLSGEVMA